MQIMRVDVIARMNRCCCKSDDLTVPTDGFSHSYVFDGDFVTCTNRLLQRDTLPGDFDGTVGVEWNHRNDDIVGGVQMDGGGLLQADVHVILCDLWQYELGNKCVQLLAYQRRIHSGCADNYDGVWI